MINRLKKWTAMHTKIEIIDHPTLTLAGVTQVGINGLEQAFEKLTTWAIPKGLLEKPSAKLGRMFFDSFKITAPNKVRMLVFLTTDTAFKTEGEITKFTINSGPCIVGHFEITPHEFEKAWTSLFLWMNENGYKKSTNNPFEIYHNDYRTHPENKFIVDLYIPIA